MHVVWHGVCVCVCVSAVLVAVCTYVRYVVCQHRTTPPTLFNRIWAHARTRTQSRRRRRRRRLVGQRVAVHLQRLSCVHCMCRCSEAFCGARTESTYKITTPNHLHSVPTVGYVTEVYARAHSRPSMFVINRKPNVLFDETKSVYLLGHNASLSQQCCFWKYSHAK